MKINHKTLLLASATTLTMLAAGGYWYVFIAGAPQLDPPQAEQNTGLQFQVETFQSQAMGEVRSYGVVLPHKYGQNPQQRYPVIFLLHGGHGGARDYQDKAALTSVLHDLYKSGKLPPSIVITPDGSDHRGSSPLHDPQYYNGPYGKVDTLIGSELVQVVKSRYRTLNQPQFWAMGGLSSGGWGAFNIGLRHLNQFSILFSHTGYFNDKSGTHNSPQRFIQQLPPASLKRLRVYLDAGEADEKYLAATQAFHQTLDRLGVANQFHVYPGGHGLYGQDVGWNYWHKHLKDSLGYVGQQFKSAQAKSAHPQPKHSPTHSVKQLSPETVKEK